MPKWFLGKRRYKSPPSYDSLSSAADLNLQYNFIKYSIDSLLYHQPNHLAQESAAKKRVKPDEDDHLNGDRLSGASPDSGYSHSPLSYSYYVDHDNADIECTESAASLNTLNHPLDLSIKTSGVTLSIIDYETISRNVDVKKSEPLSIADSVYSEYLKSEQNLDNSNYEECRKLLRDSESHDCRDEVKDVIAVNNSFTPTSSHAQTNRMSKYIDSDTTMYGGKDMNTLVHDRSVTGMFNIASQLRCATQRGRNKDHKTKSRNKFRNNDISKSNGKSRTDKACDVCRRHEHPASDIKVNTLQLVQQLLSHDRNEIQTKRCLDSVMYRIPDHPVLSADETFGVRNKQADCLTVPISDQIETKQELIPFNEPRQSDEFVPSANCVTATRLTQGKTLTRIKSEKLSTAAKSSKLVRVKQSDAYYKYADFETLCRGDLDTSLTLVDATPEARAEIEKIENKIGDYACMLCCEIFSDAFQLAGHNCSGIVHVEYRCPECSKTFNCPANLASHRRWHKPQRALAVMSEWPLDDLLQSTRYSRTLSKLGKPMLL